MLFVEQMDKVMDNLKILYFVISPVHSNTFCN